MSKVVPSIRAFLRHENQLPSIYHPIESNSLVSWLSVFHENFQSAVIRKVNSSFTVYVVLWTGRYEILLFLDTKPD